MKVFTIYTVSIYSYFLPPYNRFTALFPGPPGWAGARRELLDFMVQGKINRGRHTDHPAGRNSIRTKQCPPPPSPYFLRAGCPSCRPTNSVKALKAIATSQNIYNLCAKKMTSVTMGNSLKLSIHWAERPRVDCGIVDPQITQQILYLENQGDSVGLSECASVCRDSGSWTTQPYANILGLSFSVCTIRQRYRQRIITARHTHIQGVQKHKTKATELLKNSANKK